MSPSLFGLLALASVVMAQTQNCVLQVPPNPLSAKGLATPYKMSGCDQTQFATEACFVEAAILDPATGAIQIYNPLIINQNSSRAGVDFITPVVPTLPDNAVVGIFFGSNAVTLTLTGDTATCVNGDANGVFGQFAYCNTPAFFTAAFSAVSSGLLKIPPPGTSTKGTTSQACPVTRDFRMVDMDQSDNVDSTYLLINGKILAQNTPANAAKYKNATEFNNGSDNLLLNAFLSPTLGCTAGTFEAPCITCASGSSPAMALNELQSQFFVPTGGPALVPLNDDFTVDAGNNGSVEQSLIKTNLYRAGVGQPQAADAANASSVTYCTRYAASGLFIALNEELFTGATSPAPGASNNLFTFMANRFATSFGPVPALGCQTIFGIADSPVNQTTDGNGVVIAATINTQVLQDILDGKILPLGQASSSTTSSVNTVLSTSSASLSTSTLVKGDVDTTSLFSTSTTLSSALSTTFVLPLSPSFSQISWFLTYA
ncbi:hypothetical protein N431DRAFT_355180 [Stipitochalara longipes BDJ]|nr:hypothetical protein N431DRAFT_355180 [Stipitochalara longipes BDJ]